MEAVHSVFIYGVSADSGMNSGLHNSTKHKNIFH